MPSQYMGTPLESDWERLKRRRELNKALFEQTMQPYVQSPMVSGRVVQDAWGKGLSKLGQAAIGAWRRKKLDEEEAELSQKYETGRQKAMDEVKAALLPERTNYVEREAPGPDLLRAATAYQSPYLQNDEIARSLINTAAYGGDRGRSGYSRVFASEDGTLYQKDMRDPSAPATMLTDPEGNPLHDPRYTAEAQFSLKGAGEAGKQVEKSRYEPARAGAVATAKVLGEHEGEKVISEPIEAARSESKKAQFDRLDASISKAKEQANNWTAGFIGQTANWVPGTPQFNLSKTLGSVKSSIGFDKLAELKAEGGTLGQVSNFEIDNLQQVWASLSQGQSPEQLRDNLEIVRKAAKDAWERIDFLYKQKYGIEYSKKAESPEQETASSPQQKAISEMTDEEIMQELGLSQ